MSHRNNDITKGASRVAPTASGLLAANRQLFVVRGEKGEKGFYLYAQSVPALQDAMAHQKIKPDALMVSAYFFLERGLTGKLIVHNIKEDGELTGLAVGEVHRQQIMACSDIKDGAATPVMSGLTRPPKKGELCN